MDNEKEESTKGAFYCDLCKLEYVSGEELEEHSWSLLHHKKLDKEKGRDYLHNCSLCGDLVVGLLAFTKHIHSDKHQKSLQERRIKNLPPPEEPQQNEDGNEEGSVSKNRDSSDVPFNNTQQTWPLPYNLYNNQNQRWIRPGYEPRHPNVRFRMIRNWRPEPFPPPRFDQQNMIPLMRPMRFGQRPPHNHGYYGNFAERNMPQRYRFGVPFQETPQMIGGRLSPQMVIGRQSPQMSDGRQSPQMVSGRQLPQTSSGRQSPQIDSGRQLPQTSSGTQAPQMVSGRQLPQTSSGTQAPQMVSGRQPTQSSSGRQSPLIITGMQSTQMSDRSQSKQTISGRQLPQTSDGRHLSFKIATSQKQSKFNGQKQSSANGMSVQQQSQANGTTGQKHPVDNDESLYDVEKFQGFNAVKSMKEKLKGLSQKRPRELSNGSNNSSKKARTEKAGIEVDLTTQNKNTNDGASSSRIRTGSKSSVGSFTIMSRTTENCSDLNASKAITDASNSENNKGTSNIVTRKPCPFISDDEEESLAMFVTENLYKKKDTPSKTPKKNENSTVFNTNNDGSATLIDIVRGDKNKETTSCQTMSTSSSTVSRKSSIGSKNASSDETTVKSSVFKTPSKKSIISEGSSEMSWTSISSKTPVASYTTKTPVASNQSSTTETSKHSTISASTAEPTAAKSTGHTNQMKHLAQGNRPERASPSEKSANGAKKSTSIAKSPASLLKSIANAYQKTQNIVQSSRPDTARTSDQSANRNKKTASNVDAVLDLLSGNQQSASSKGSAPDKGKRNSNNRPSLVDLSEEESVNSSRASNVSGTESSSSNKNGRTSVASGTAAAGTVASGTVASGTVASGTVASTASFVVPRTSSMQQPQGVKAVPPVKGEARGNVSLTSSFESSIMSLDESFKSLSDSSQCEFLYQDRRRCPSNANTNTKFCLYHQKVLRVVHSHITQSTSSSTSSKADGGNAGTQRQPTHRTEARKDAVSSTRTTNPNTSTLTASSSSASAPSQSTSIATSNSTVRQLCSSNSALRKTSQASAVASETIHSDLTSGSETEQNNDSTSGSLTLSRFRYLNKTASNATNDNSARNSLPFVVRNILKRYGSNLRHRTSSESSVGEEASNEPVPTTASGNPTIVQHATSKSLMSSGKKNNEKQPSLGLVNSSSVTVTTASTASQSHSIPRQAVPVASRGPTSKSQSSSGKNNNEKQPSLGLVNSSSVTVTTLPTASTSSRTQSLPHQVVSVASRGPTSSSKSQTSSGKSNNEKQPPLGLVNSSSVTASTAWTASRTQSLPRQAVSTASRGPELNRSSSGTVLSHVNIGSVSSTGSKTYQLCTGGPTETINIETAPIISIASNVSPTSIRSTAHSVSNVGATSSRTALTTCLSKRFNYADYTAAIATYKNALKSSENSTDNGNLEPVRSEYQSESCAEATTNDIRNSTSRRIEIQSQSGDNTEKSDKQSSNANSDSNTAGNTLNRQAKVLREFFDNLKKNRNDPIGTESPLKIAARGPKQTISGDSEAGNEVGDSGKDSVVDQSKANLDTPKSRRKSKTEFFAKKKAGAEKRKLERQERKAAEMEENAARNQRQSSNYQMDVKMLLELENKMEMKSNELLTVRNRVTEIKNQIQVLNIELGRLSAAEGFALIDIETNMRLRERLSKSWKARYGEDISLALDHAREDGNSCGDGNSAGVSSIVENLRSKANRAEADNGQSAEDAERKRKSKSKKKKWKKRKEEKLQNLNNNAKRQEDSNIIFSASASSTYAHVTTSPTNITSVSTTLANISSGSTAFSNIPSVSTTFTNIPSVSTALTNIPSVSTASANIPSVSTAFANIPSVSTSFPSTKASTLGRNSGWKSQLISNNGKELTQVSLTTALRENILPQIYDNASTTSSGVGNISTDRTRVETVNKHAKKILSAEIASNSTGTFQIQRQNSNTTQENSSAVSVGNAPLITSKTTNHIDRISLMYDVTDVDSSSSTSALSSLDSMLNADNSVSVSNSLTKNSDGTNSNKNPRSAGSKNNGRIKSNKTARKSLMGRSPLDPGRFELLRDPDENYRNTETINLARTKHDRSTSSGASLVRTEPKEAPREAARSSTSRDVRSAKRSEEKLRSYEAFQRSLDLDMQSERTARSRSESSTPDENKQTNRDSDQKRTGSASSVRTEPGQRRKRVLDKSLNDKQPDSTPKKQRLEKEPKDRDKKKAEPSSSKSLTSNRDPKNDQKATDLKSLPKVLLQDCILSPSKSNNLKIASKTTPSPRKAAKSKKQEAKYNEKSLATIAEQKIHNEERIIASYKTAVTGIKIYKEMICTCGFDNLIRIHYNRQNDASPTTLIQCKKPVTCIEIDRNDKEPRLFVGLNDRRVECFSLNTFRSTQNFIFNQPVTCMHCAFGSLYVGLNDGYISTISLQTKKLTGSFYCYRSGGTSINFMVSTTMYPEIRYIITGVSKKNIVVQEYLTGRSIANFSDSRSVVTCLEMHGKTLFCGSMIGEVLMYDLEKMISSEVFCKQKSSIRALKTTGDHLLVASSDHVIRSYHIERKQLLQIIGGHEQAVSCLAMDIDNRIYSGDMGGVVKSFKIHARINIVCEWQSCGLYFPCLDQMKAHVFDDHFRKFGKVICKWKSCLTCFIIPTLSKKQAIPMRNIKAHIEQHVASAVTSVV